jgi:photosystem II P680 reaction center D2 protein
MTITIGQVQTKKVGLFFFIDDWLKRDRFVFVGWSGITSYSLVLI